jgi:hypothetical protein
MSVFVSPGQVAQITLYSAVLMYGNGIGDSFLDPVVYIDPDQPNASLYTLALSPGIPNGAADTAGTPEPASLLLAGSAMLLFGLVQCGKRRQRNAVSR